MNDFFITFLMIGYLFKHKYGCDSSTILTHHSTLSEAIDYCNGHANCNCVEFYKSSPDYRTYGVTTQKSYTDYDSWVISILINQTIDRIIFVFLSYHTLFESFYCLLFL